MNLPALALLLAAAGTPGEATPARFALDARVVDARVVNEQASARFALQAELAPVAPAAWRFVIAAGLRGSDGKALDGAACGPQGDTLFADGFES